MRALRWLVALGLLPSAACAWWMAGRPSDFSDVDRLKFRHALHLSQDLECNMCHEGVETSTSTELSFLPKEQLCLECHDREDNCGMCHTNPSRVVARAVRDSAITFSHKAHLPRAEEGCVKCHLGARLPEGEDAQTSSISPGLPAMSTCLSCHNHRDDYAAARCRPCHETLQRVPLRAVAELEHGGDWLGRHGLLARSVGAQCEQCHSQTKCAECHSRVPAASGVRLFPEAVGRSQLHRGDWTSTHAMEARADGESCLRCHETRSCFDCHRASRVAPGLADPRAPHPPGYLRRGGEAFHGEEARLHIETCAACHDQGAASNCVECHRVGGSGGSPHPEGWSKRSRGDELQSEPSCLVCHLAR